MFKSRKEPVDSVKSYRGKGDGLPPVIRGRKRMRKPGGSFPGSLITSRYWCPLSSRFSFRGKTW